MPDEELDAKFAEPWQVKYTLMQGEIRRNQRELDEKLAVFRDEQRFIFKELQQMLVHLADRVDGNPDTRRALTYEEYSRRKRDLDDWYNRSNNSSFTPINNTLPPF